MHDHDPQGHGNKVRSFKRHAQPVIMQAGVSQPQEEMDKEILIMYACCVHASNVAVIGFTAHHFSTKQRLC